MGEYDLCVNLNYEWIQIMGGGTYTHTDTNTSIPWIGLALGPGLVLTLNLTHLSNNSLSNAFKILK